MNLDNYPCRSVISVPIRVLFLIHPGCAGVPARMRRLHCSASSPSPRASERLTRRRGAEERSGRKRLVRHGKSEQGSTYL